MNFLEIKNQLKENDDSYPFHIIKDEDGYWEGDDYICLSDKENIIGGGDGTYHYEFTCDTWKFPSYSLDGIKSNPTGHKKNRVFIELHFEPEKYNKKVYNFYRKEVLAKLKDVITDDYEFFSWDKFKPKKGGWDKNDLPIICIRPKRSFDIKELNNATELISVLCRFDEEIGVHVREILSGKSNIILKSEKSEVEAEVLAIGDVINTSYSSSFVIPDYQRPYTWDKKNVLQLLEDINKSRNSGKRSYLIGSVILYNNQEENRIEIVDGQQRLTTISLIYKAINKKKSIDALKMKLKYTHSSSFQNIALNYSIIEDWIKLNIQNEEESFWEYLLYNCKIVRILVSELGEAFQMFDSQNGRGKPLLAYNLLKAYHIRAMELIPQEEKILCDRRWENAAIYAPVPGNNKIANIDILEGLFNNQLYKTRIWCKKIAAQNFSKEKISEFKGFTVDKNHPIEFPYQNPQLLQYLTEKFYHSTLEGTVGTKSRFESGDSDCVNPFVSITQAIVNGKSFFDYVESYVDLYKKLFIELNTYEAGDFKEFYYKYCLNYDYKNSDQNKKSGRFLDNSFIAVGKATRVGDSYLREVYKSLIFLLFDKFGESILQDYYKILYRIVYSQRLLLTKIDPDSKKIREFPIKYFNLIKNAKDKAELSDLKAFAIQNTSNIGNEAPVQLDDDVFNFIKGKK